MGVAGGVNQDIPQYRRAIVGGFLLSPSESFTEL
jgi:hypothetical protein